MPDLDLLPADRSVTLTGEQHHQHALAAYAPFPREVVVELGWCRIASGKYAGRRGVEARLGGRRIGELTFRMSERYAPVISDALARGARPGCVAVLRVEERGIQAELRLPAADATAGRAVPRPRGPVDAAGVPAPRTPGGVPTGTGAPRPAPPPFQAPSQAPPPRKRRALPVLVAASVVGLFTLIGIGSRYGDPAVATRTGTAERTSAAAAPNAPASPPVGTAPAPLAPASAPSTTGPTPIPASTRAEPSRGASRTSAAPSIRRSSAPTNTAPTNTAPTSSKATPKPTKAAGSGCHPNYAGACVPIASDVDCEGGSGNGPAYVRGPVRIVGEDVYGLDGGGKPGIGCE
ncbi:hypothetical protein [Pseudonocardia sp.]|uniref:hypothetical protein n=1 Tax=Pseudonocardia sp. TaxID=60912 RepID=UPI003D0FCA63